MAAGGQRGSDELPVYLARPGTAAVPRQKRGGLFCSVEGAFESKTLDFGALRVGQRRATPSAARPEPAPAAVPEPDPGEVRVAADKERLQNLSPDGDKVRAGRRDLVPVRELFSGSAAGRVGLGAAAEGAAVLRPGGGNWRQSLLLSCCCGSGCGFVVASSGLPGGGSAVRLGLPQRKERKLSCYLPTCRAPLCELGCR